MAFLNLAPRDTSEPHRVSTILELMFDLASVIAIAAAAAGLHHGIAENHWMEVLPGFIAAFFMIWWSWMNYTWFASAYDNQSAAFQILTMITMFGALTIAAGIPDIFSGNPIYLSLAGFVIMRIAMAVFWLAAARGHPERRKTALGYAAGIAIMQLYWVWLVLNIPPQASLYVGLFILGMVGEISVPAFSERFGGPTSWHRHHIIERYGLLNIIVLGECFLGIVLMIRSVESGAITIHFVDAIACAAITFCLWGVYFTKESHLADEQIKRALLWGYGHFAIFAAGAATGAGFAVFHDTITSHSKIGLQTASFSIAVPVAIYLLSLWIVRDRFCLKGAKLAVMPLAALLIIVMPLLFSNALIPIAVMMIATVWLRRRGETQENFISI